MATKNRYVELPLDQPRRLRYTINAIREIEGTFGGGIAGVFDSKILGWNHVTTLVYYGLKHGDPDGYKKFSTPDKVGDLLQKHWVDADKGGLKELLDVVFEGMKASGVISIEVAEDQEKEAVDDASPLVNS